MAKRDRALQRAKDGPKGWRFEQLRRLLEQYGFEVHSRKGSHFFAEHPDTDIQPPLVKHSRELSPWYVKTAIKAIEEVIARQGVDNE